MTVTPLPPSPPRLSALVVARDEAAQLADCLATLRFADEILVVLDRTTDASAAIATACGARVLEGAWEIEGERRNAGLDACAGEWILEVDADERIPPALAEEVRQVIANSPHAWHPVPVDNYVGTRLVRHGWGGSFGTTLVPRLSRRGAKRWQPQRVHPEVAWRGPEGPRLRQPLVHHVDRDISDMLRRLGRYTDARAADLIARGEIGSTASNLRRFVSRFFKCLVGRGGWREGGWGLLIALCAGLYPLLAHLKAKLEPERYGGGALPGGRRGARHAGIMLGGIMPGSCVPGSGVPGGIAASAGGRRPESGSDAPAPPPREAAAVPAGIAAPPVPVREAAASAAGGGTLTPVGEAAVPAGIGATAAPVGDEAVPAGAAG